MAPVGAGRHTDQFGEARAEGAQRRAADRETDLGHAEVATTQQRHRPLDPPRHQIAVRRLAVGEPELAAEVPGRHVRAAGERLDVQRLRVLRVEHRQERVEVAVAGRSEERAVFARLLRVFPDLHVVIEDLIAEGDKVVSRNTVTGTHQGDYMGHPPTGKPVTYNEIFIFRFAGGRIAGTWGVVDVFSQMKQVGVIPGTPGDPHVEAARKAA